MDERHRRETQSLSSWGDIPRPVRWALKLILAVLILAFVTGANPRLLDVAAGLFFVVFGAFLISRPDDFIAKSSQSALDRRIRDWVEDTAYGRWFRPKEPMFVRLMGCLLLVVGAAIMLSSV